MKPLLILILFGLVPLSGIAADATGKYAIRGAGLVDCKTFLDEQAKQSPAYLMMGGWIDGYINGVSQYAPQTYDATSFESTELFAEIVKNHCKKNPEHRLYRVINSIIAQRWDNRITAQSALITVQNGANKTQLYQETIVRMQARLAELGHFKLPTTGKFDAATISALAAYQKTQKGFEATGFPDQATLWGLLAD